jgi:hypothetical protein
VRCAIAVSENDFQPGEIFMNTQAQIIAAIKALESSQKQQLNRHLACEAMLVAIVRRLPPPALAGVLEEYDAAIDRAAALLDPQLQIPDIWQQMSDGLRGYAKSVGAAPGLQDRQAPGAG